MPIQSIVQYEVYVHDHGRWALHARYPGAERDDAILDARKTELATGLPTQVVRDTYYPEENVSEEATVYVSPQYKQKLAAGKKANGKRPSKGAQQKINGNNADVQSTKNMRRATDAQFFSKLILALGVSLIIATCLTGFFALLLSAGPKLGISIPAAIGAKMTFYWFICMFLLSTVALNRAYVPWPLMLRRLKSKPAPEPEFLQPETQMAFRPKYPASRREAEVTAAQSELKFQRGDIEKIEDVLPPVVSVEKDASVEFELAQKADETKDDADEYVSGDSGATEEETVSAECESEDSPSPVSLDTPTDDPPVPLADMDIDRLLMMRFLGEAIVNLRNSQDQIDRLNS